MQNLCYLYFSIDISTQISSSVESQKDLNDNTDSATPIDKNDQYKGTFFINTNKSE